MSSPPLEGPGVKDDDALAIASRMVSTRGLALDG
jgi:hypothetical protein